jgi:hypothetical protein
MIAILPLLLAQAQPAAAPVVLSADGTEAMRCAATTGALVSSEEMRIVAATSYYLMMAARSDRGTGPFLPRVQELSPLVTQYKVSVALAPAIAADCRKRFPLAWTTAPATLPTDPFARDVTCAMAISIMVGGAEGLQKTRGDSTYADRSHAAQKRFKDRMTNAVLTQHGIATPAQFVGFAGDQLLASLPFGNVSSISATCEAQPL